MNNNKGYYHWIHSLNQASRQVQHNHAKLLYEAQYNATISGESGLKQGKTRIHGTPRGGVVGSGTEEQAANIAAGMGELLKKVNEVKPEEGQSTTPLRMGSSPTSLQAARVARNVGGLARSIANRGGLGFGDEDFEPLSDTPSPGPQTTPEELGRIADMQRARLASTPHRTADAEDKGINAARDRARSAETAAKLFASKEPKFTGTLAAKARIEAGHGVAGDVELAAKDMKPTQADLDNNGIVGDAGDVALDASDNVMDNDATVDPNELTRRANIRLRTSGVAQRNESVSSIINKMLNG